MADVDIFLSVGGTATDAQEAFVRAVEDRLRAEGLSPRTVGRNTFSADAPLKAITELMAKCSGVVVVALERKYFPAGVEKRGGPKAAPLADVALPTPWNQIEAAMGYSKGLPLLVIVEDSVRPEGLLEPGNDWYVQRVALDRASLATNEFNGVLASWKGKVSAAPSRPAAAVKTDQLTIGDLVAGMKPAQLWSLLAALLVLAGAAFALGQKLAG